MSNTLWLLMLTIAASLPLAVAAQDEATPASEETGAAPDQPAAAEPPAEAAPSEASADAAASAPLEGEAAPEATADAAAAENETAPAESAEAAPPAEEAVAEAASEEAPSEEAPEAVAEREPYALYFGADRGRLTFSASDDSLRQSFDPTAATADRRRNYSSDFYTLRAGIRMFNAIGFEGQYGIADDDGDDSGQVEVKDFFAFYLVPTATVFDLIELSARLGYASFEVANDSASNDSDGVSFGVGIELPLQQFAEFLPDIRLTTGATVWHVSEDSRSYGFHYGLRYDFKI